MLVLSPLQLSNIPLQLGNISLATSYYFQALYGFHTAVNCE